MHRSPLSSTLPQVVLAFASGTAFYIVRRVTGSQVGIAIPNYYLITPDGVIRNRWEESTLENRVTANYFYETLYGAGTAAPTVRATTHAPHLDVILTQSDTHSAPGARIRLAVRLKLDQFTHVYAPGAEANGYRPVKLTLDASELYSSILLASS